MWNKTLKDNLIIDYYILYWLLLSIHWCYYFMHSKGVNLHYTHPPIPKLCNDLRFLILFVVLLKNVDYTKVESSTLFLLLIKFLLLMDKKIHLVLMILNDYCFKLLNYLIILGIVIISKRLLIHKVIICLIFYLSRSSRMVIISSNSISVHSLRENGYYYLFGFLKRIGAV